MNRLRALTIGGALLAALILVVFAYFIADAQSEDKEDVEQRFRDVAQVSAAVTNGIFDLRVPGHADPGRRGLRRSDRPAGTGGLRAQGQSQYVVVYDKNGRRLGARRHPPPGPAVDTARETGQPRLSDVMGTGEDATIEFAIPYETPTGRRIFVTGSPTKPFADFLAASLGNLPTEFGATPRPR